MLRIDRAIQSTLMVEPGKLSLGESQGGPTEQELIIENNSRDWRIFRVSHVPALATGPNTFSVSYFNAPSTVTFSETEFEVPPRGGAIYIRATITPNPMLPDKSIYGGYIVVTSETGEVARVPYAGFKGDYQSIQVLAPTPAGFPWLAKLIGGSFENQPNGAAYSMVGSDIPFIIIHLDHQSRRLLMEVFDANTGTSFNKAEDDSYLPRNSGANTAFVLPWDGTTFRGTRTQVVPNGSYIIKLTVRKALGSEEDVETWTSPVITLARP